MKSNPLIQAYRKPALYVTLPSGGRFYNPKPTLSVDGELAIYSMTARDELITKTPDALYNGEATVALINSCCPDIENPKQIPISDLIVLMLAIRTASYGKELDMDIRCPECNAINMLALDGIALLGSAKSIDSNTTVKLDNGFVVHTQPYNLEDRTLLQLQQMKQNRLIQGLIADDATTDAEKNKLFGTTFLELADLTVQLISNCITQVDIPDSESISDDEIITEWLSSVNKSDYDKIKEKVERLSQPAIDGTMKASCQECSHQWETEVDLDIANFFAG